MTESLNPWLSLVIPAYNEEESIEECVREADQVLRNIGKDYEILVIDDGSLDRTFDRLLKLREEIPALRALRFKHNRGQSAAMAAGFHHARGEIVVTMDADLQNDPSDIPSLLEQTEEWDVVCGWRQKRQDNAIRLISSKIANGVRNRLSHESIRDTGCTLKAYRREYLEKIKLFEGMHRFLPTLLRMEGATVTEVRVKHRPRLQGKTKYGIGNRLWRGLRDLIAVRWMMARFIRYEISEKID